MNQCDVSFLLCQGTDNDMDSNEDKDDEDKDDEDKDDEEKDDEEGDGPVLYREQLCKNHTFEED